MQHDREHNVYHPQLWVDVWQTQDPWLYEQLDIPRSTRLTWRDTPPPDDIVGLELFAVPDAELRRKVDRLERRIRVLVAVVRLLLTLVRVLGVDLRHRRVPDGRDKARILRAIDRAAGVIGLASALRVIRLSTSRFHTWASRPTCLLADQPTCPRRSPTHMRFADVAAIGEMVLDTTLRHMSTPQLALHAQRIGRVFASVSTWYRYMHLRGWARPLTRLHFSPREGIRASRPNEVWHIDETRVTLADGTKLWIQAIIDNFSRFILAWRVSTEHGGAYSLDLLREAEKLLRFSERPPKLVCDDGGENFNEAVDDHLLSGVLRRILAQVDIVHSNSMIERLWMALKHRCLFLHHLASKAVVEDRTSFFVTQHNTVTPQVVHGGRTPQEVYFGLAVDLPAQLAVERARARQERIDYHRSLSCGACEPRQNGPPRGPTRVGPRELPAGEEPSVM